MVEGWDDGDGRGGEEKKKVHRQGCLLSTRDIEWLWVEVEDFCFVYAVMFLILSTSFYVHCHLYMLGNLFHMC